MPTPRKYATNAARQAAYRTRCTAAPAAPLPASPSRPGTRRWAVMIGQAQELLTGVAGEMAIYGDAHSDAWQNSERGEAFLERVEALEEIRDLLRDLAADHG